eukprot:1018337-Amphidinium_carterae.1
MKQRSITQVLKDRCASLGLDFCGVPIFLARASPCVMQHATWRQRSLMRWHFEMEGVRLRADAVAPFGVCARDGRREDSTSVTKRDTKS